VLSVSDGRIDGDRAIEAADRILTGSGATIERISADLAHGLPAGRGDVRAQILREIAEGDVDLAVLGTAGVGALRRAMLGSTASAVAHHALCSVLVACEPKLD
jgi:nucleotide-binding universal stress UspA family protein